MILAQITEDPISVESVLARVGSAACGAVLVFLGVVRDHHEGRRVTGLEYEAYREMAEEVLATIGQEATDRYAVESVAMIHRVGALEVGETSLAIAVGSAHRADSYEASRYVIESVKARVPVWKKEHFAEGTSEWVRGTDPRRTSERGRVDS